MEPHTGFRQSLVHIIIESVWQLHLPRMQIHKRLLPHALGALSLVIIVQVQLQYAQMVSMQV